jgi:hypothetical protein
MKKDAKKFNSITMRNILSFLMVLLVLGAGVGFYFGLQFIKTYALDVSHTVSDASASRKNVEQLGVLKQELVERSTLVTKANQLFATSDTYQLQSLKDIQKYASDAGITITNTEFDKDVAPTGAATPPTATVSGTHSVLVTLQSPVSYAKFLQFLDAIEGNLPKMQITGVSISRPNNASGDQISSDKLTITVATR